MATLDTHAIGRTLIDARADPKLADAITAAVREAADHGDHVTPDQFKAGLTELEARLTWRFAGAMLAQMRSSTRNIGSKRASPSGCRPGSARPRASARQRRSTPA